MLIHQIKHKNKDIKRIGRGGKKGTYSGKGIKGQKSRAGRKIAPALRDLILKLPKRRGYRFKSIQEKPLVLNISAINEKFNNGETVNANFLKAKKIINIKKSDKNPKIKILSAGELDKKLIFAGNLMFSEKAREKIIKSGSNIENLE